MADSSIAVTPGSGANIDVRTEATNGDARQVIVIGDPSTTAGVAPVDGTKGLAVDLTATGANTTALKVNVASGGIASGAIASGAIASGAIASGAVASGAYAAGSIADGAQVTLGAKADAKSTATDTTSVSVMSVLKQISASVQAPPSQAVTNAGTFAAQAAITAASGSIASGAVASGAFASGAIASGAVASGAYAAGSIADGAQVTLGAKADAKSTATDTTSVSVMSVLKQISASVQAPPSQAVTNAGTFAAQAAGDVASGSSDSGSPVKIGAVGHTAAPTAVTDGQRVNLIADKVGKLIAVGAIRDLKGITQTQISASTSETTIVAAVASTFCDLYGLILANTGASTTKVTIKDSTSGTTRAIIEVPTLETRGFMLPVDSAIPQAAVNTNWTATCGTSTTALEVTAMWVKNI